MLEPQITVYGAPWCPDCKRSKQFLGDQRVPYNWVDIDRDENGRQHVQEINNGKQIIPTIEFADGSILVEPTDAELAAKLGIQPRADRQYYDLIIVGGGPTGLTTAIYSAREGIDTLVIERSTTGGQAGTTELIDNYPGFSKGVAGAELGTEMRAQAERFGAEILTAQGVDSIKTMGDLKIVTTPSGDEYCARAILVATGSRYRRLNSPGEEDFIGAGIHFCATCDGPFYKGQHVIVVGGGNSGVQEAIFLTKFVDKVTLLERGDRLRASQSLQDKAAELDQIEIRTNATIDEFKGDTRLRSVVVRDVNTNEIEEIEAPGAFIFIGLDPNTDFVKGTVDVDQFGFLSTDMTLQTSVPGVFAAGDVRAGD